MRINDNIPALQAYTNLLSTNRRVDRATIRVSSGVRINSVKDDAAGMAISNKLKFQISGIDMAGRNTMDGISIVQVAEGALQEVHNMLQRIRELAVQSSNDSNTAEDRLKIDMEARQLLDELDATAQKTEFNNMKVLYGDGARLAKIPAEDRVFASVTYVSDPVPNAALNYTVENFGLPASVTTGGANLATAASLVGQKIVIGRDEFTVEDGDTATSILTKFQALLNTNDLDAKVLNGGAWSDYENGTENIIVFTKDAGSDQHIYVGGDPALISALGLSPGDTKGIDANLKDGSATTTVTPAQPASVSVPATTPLLTDITAAAGQSITIGGSTYMVTGTETPAQLQTELLTLLTSEGLTYTVDTPGWPGTGGLTIETPGTGATEQIVISGGSDALALFGIAAGTANGAAAVTVTTPNLSVDNEPYAYSARGNHVEITSSSGKKIVMELKITGPNDSGEFETILGESLGTATGGAQGVDATFCDGNAREIEMLNFGQFQLHIGPNKNQTLKMQIPAMTTEAMQVSFLHLKNWEGSQKAINQAQQAIEYVSEARGRLGAYQNRLEHTHASLGVTGENTSGALSRIYDADMAKEISLLSKDNVLMQAGMSVLAQANQRPQQILQLLQ